jgi:hypothetical protein
MGCLSGNVGYDGEVGMDWEKKLRAYLDANRDRYRFFSIDFIVIEAKTLALGPGSPVSTEAVRRVVTQWSQSNNVQIAPLMPKPGRRDRQREVDFREVINAVRYLVRSGCGWRMLPIRSGLGRRSMIGSANWHGAFCFPRSPSATAIALRSLATSIPTKISGE